MPWDGSDPRMAVPVPLRGGALRGRVAVVTGATSGIGREIARGLAQAGATTVVVGRGPERTAAAAAQLARETGNPDLEPMPVDDLALLSETRNVASRLLGRHDRIDILVNNAGAMFTRRERTTEGHERTFALNVLSPFLLTSLLAGRLIESAPARVVNVASAAHRGRSVDFSDLESAARYSGFGVYGRSKLELILLTRELARRLSRTGVTVNAVHPGFVRSGFGQNTPGATAIAIRGLARVFGRSPLRGAETPLFVAVDPSLEGVTGTYFSERTAQPGSRASQDPDDAERLYRVCRELTEAPDLPSSGAETGSDRP